MIPAAQLRRKQRKEKGQEANPSCSKGLETVEMICKKSGGDTNRLHNVGKLGWEEIQK